MSYPTLSHRFDVFAKQVANELPEVEAPNRGVACCQGGSVGFHAALTELASVFGMADERNRFESSYAARFKRSVGLYVAWRP
jgi:hypothetical protein